MIAFALFALIISVTVLAGGSWVLGCAIAAGVYLAVIITAEVLEP